MLDFEVMGRIFSILALLKCMKVIFFLTRLRYIWYQLVDVYIDLEIIHRKIPSKNLFPKRERGAFIKILFDKKVGTYYFIGSSTK